MAHTHTKKEKVMIYDTWSVGLRKASKKPVWWNQSKDKKHRKMLFQFTTFFQKKKLINRCTDEFDWCHINKIIKIFFCIVFKN